MTRPSENGTSPGLHYCEGCGLELDGDDPSARCDECSAPPGPDGAA